MTLTIKSSGFKLSTWKVVRCVSSPSIQAWTTANGGKHTWASARPITNPLLGGFLHSDHIKPWNALISNNVNLINVFLIKKQVSMRLTQCFTCGHKHMQRSYWILICINPRTPLIHAVIPRIFGWSKWGNPSKCIETSGSPWTAIKKA